MRLVRSQTMSQRERFELLQAFADGRRAGAGDQCVGNRNDELRDTMLVLLVSHGDADRRMDVGWMDRIRARPKRGGGGNGGGLVGNTLGVGQNATRVSKIRCRKPCRFSMFYPINNLPPYVTCDM